MPTYTIASSGNAAYGTITQPFSVPTNIEFLNDSDTFGVVIFTRGAIGVAVAGTPGDYTSSAYFNGSITNFLPGTYNGAGGIQDYASIQVFESLFSAMNVGDQADTADFEGQETYAAQSGEQIIIVNGTAQWTQNAPFTLTANEAQIIDDIAIGLFGTGANTATLDLAFNLRPNPNSNHPFIDGVFTTFTPINPGTGSETNPNPCFAAGTLILTTRGEIPVETLSVGDLVISPDGEEQPIIWIGTRRVENMNTYRRPEAVRPIIIEAGALGDNMPSRNLALSPDHAIYLDGVLVPAKELVNWNSIHQDHRINNITYYHLELPKHGIIFAESTPTESYLDTGGRGAFDNDQSPITELHPTRQHRRDTEACAPLCYAGPQLETIRARIAARQVGIRLAVG